MNSIEMNHSKIDPFTKEASKITKQASSSSFQARRRWKLIKNVGLAVRRRTSLTEDEEKFLEKLKKRKDAPSIQGSTGLSSVSEGMESSNIDLSDTRTLEDQGDADDKIRMSLQSRKSNLRKSIQAQALSLTEAESKFLNDLASEDLGISDEQIDRVQQILHSDPLFNPESGRDPSAHSEDKNVNNETQRDSIVNEKQCFRREVWMNFSSRGEIATEDDDFEKPLSIDTTEENNCFFNCDKGSPLNAFLQMFSSGQKTAWSDADEQKEEDINQLRKDEETSMEEKRDEIPPENSIDDCILATHVDDEDCSPHVLSPAIMRSLREHLPYAIQEDNFWLKYSLMRDGASIRSLLQRVRCSSRTILAIETTDGDVFGSFTSSLWRPQGATYYGSGESFLWRLKNSRYTSCKTLDQQIQLERDVEVFKWSGDNYNVQSLRNMDSELIIGGGASDDDQDYFNNPYSYRGGELKKEEEKINSINDDNFGPAIILDPHMERGTSSSCVTFKSPTLTTVKSNDYKDDDIFRIANVEMWTMTPVEDLQEAEQLELGRQFIFDQIQ